MPNKKNFPKDKCTKYVLLHGNREAVNADGQTLQNVFVPVHQNYKSGSSLLVSKFTTLCNSGPTESSEQEPDLENIINQLDDSEGGEDLPSKMKQLTLPEQKSKLLKEKVDGGDDDEEEEEEEEFDYDDDAFFAFKSSSDTSYDSFIDNLDDDSDDDIQHQGNYPEHKKVLNARFKQIWKQYGMDQIGSLDDEEISGTLSYDCKQVKDTLDSEFKHKKEEVQLGNYDADIKKKILQYAEESDDEKVIEITVEKPLEFDCESVLSTYSNQYNHPAVISEAKKIKIPNNPLRKKLTKSQLKTLSTEKESDDESDDNSSAHTASFNVRTKDETPEQRRERKSLFKEAKRESRMLKKENKLAFKKEKKLQKAQNLNAQQNAGIKLL